MSPAALPPLDAAAIPPQVRDTGRGAIEGFRAALGFERVLLAELLGAALPEGAGGEALPASLPGTLADAIIAAGGAGVAADLYESFAPAR